MDNVNKIKIICDPYQKTIEYLWYDCNLEKYVSPNPKTSKLANKDYTNTVIQNRAYEIANIICNEYCTGNIGLNILFTGTEDDYNDFCRVLNTYHNNAKITCVKDNLYYETAEKVMPKIKDEFYSIQSYFKDYSEDKIKDLIDKYNDTVKPSISLCVVGLYSAGKSAFINSIIGEELLPSASDPTTGKVCKITYGKKYKITFWHEENECTIEFNEKSYRSSAGGDNEIIKQLEEALQTNHICSHNEIYFMNAALKILNDYKNEGNKAKIGEIVDIVLPFKNSKLPIDEFDFVVYDTPGSNSAKNIQHFEILKKSLSEQTNALPIFVTNPDTMDSEDNKKVLALIKEASAYLDTANAMVVVNKADEKAHDTLSKKKANCQNLMISDWRSTSIFFMSSLIGIASKKDNPDDKAKWYDNDMFEIYDEKKEKYLTNKRRLFEYNIIDQSKTDVVATGYSEDSKTAHLYKNSGLESIEKEIADYARKYALYNKCQKASAYLQEAITLCMDNINKLKEKNEEELKKAREYFNDKQNVLIDDLEEKKNDIKRYNTEFQNLMDSIATTYKKENNLSDDKASQKALSNDLYDKWKEIKHNKKNDPSIMPDVRIQIYISGKYRDHIHNFMERTNNSIKQFWKDKTNYFRTQCAAIISENNILTEGQKKVLTEITMEQFDVYAYCNIINLKEIGALRQGWFTKKFKFDKEICSREFVKSFNSEISKSILRCVSNNNESIGHWSYVLIAKLESKLCEFNHNLNNISKKISAIQEDTQNKVACKNRLTESKLFIDGLITVQEGEENE